jgi:hypothetical protein
MTILAQSSRYFHNGSAVASTNYDYGEGWLTAKADNCLIAVCCATLTASLLDYRIEGRFDTYNRAVELHNATTAAIHTIDQAINITEKVKEIRVGVKVDDASATPNVFYAGLCLTEQK